MNSRRNTLIVIGVILLAALLLASWYVFLVRTNTDSGAPSTFSPYTEGVGTTGVGRGGAQSGSTPGNAENTDGGFGTGSGSLTPPSNTSIAEEVKGQRPETPTFTEIETDISGGYSIVPTLDDLYTLYSVDRARGYVYTINPLTKEKTRVSNVTIPKIIDVNASESGAYIVIRSFGDNDIIESRMINLRELNDDGSIKETGVVRLPDGITDVIMTSELYFLRTTATNGSEIVRTALPYNPDITNALTTLWTSPLRDWGIEKVNTSTILITQKPSFNIPGYAYTLNTQTKKVTKILGDLPGLVSLPSPKGDIFLFTTYGTNSYQSFIYSPQTKARVYLEQLVIPEKCAWSENGLHIYCAIGERIPIQMPNAWYNGSIPITDTKIIHIDPQTGKTTSTISLTANKVSIDVQKITVAPNLPDIIMIDKMTGNLWMLQLP